MTDFLLPDLGEGLPDAELVQWRVAVGDTVTVNQPIAEVETAKAVIDLPSPYAGVVTALHHEAGTVVDVGSVLISFTVEGETPAAPAAPVADAAPSEDEEVVPPNLVGYGAAPTSKQRPARRARGAAAAPAPAAPAAVAPAAAPVPAVRAERPRSTPPVRKLARDLGIDLETITGTGPEGRIVREDVQRAAEGTTVPAPAVASAPVVRTPGERETRTPIRGVRKFTAAAMVQSAFTAPHVTEFHTIDVTPTMEFIKRLRADKRWADQRINFLAIVAKAVCAAIAQEPSLNSSWDEAAGEIVEYGYVNLGIAAATPRGLVVPNIQDAEQRNVAQLSTAIRELAETARAGQTAPAAMSGGTFTITNIGTFGVEAGTPIINPGEAAILAVGAVQRRPWEYQGEVALRDVCTLSISFDHRLVDGAEGSRFLTAVGEILADPARVMLFG